MTINFEVKKDGMRQMQDGMWKLSLTIMPEDMPMDLLQAPMGAPYALAMVPIDYDNPETEVITVHPDAARIDSAPKPEGEKLRIRAVMLCKEESFWEFLDIDSGHQNKIKEGIASQCIYDVCNIGSRKELATNKDAQKVFKDLLIEYGNWGAPSIEEQYKDNFEQCEV